MRKVVIFIRTLLAVAVVGFDGMVVIETTLEIIAKLKTAEILGLREIGLNRAYRL